MYTKMYQFLLIYNVIYLVEASSIKRSLIITTNSGSVKGKLNEFNGIDFYSYQGIPYAENPTGNLRFKPPVPKKPWKDVLDATKEGAICIQVPKFHLIEETSEDCLNINVYVPKNGTDELLPVMVFIHGGALQYLSGHINISYGPQFIVAHKIIYVSMNYRLGPFGFLSLDIKEASGNAGLKDVLLSLKWIKRNIQNFGGDPNKVTISGHSAGALIVNFLILTDQLEGLFHQAMQFSGNAFNPRSFSMHPKNNAYALAKELGIETQNVYMTLKKLQKVEASEIIRACINMSKMHDSPLRWYAPFVVTKEVKSEHAVVVMNPMEALRKSKRILQKVPVLVGITSQESINMIPYVFEKFKGLRKIRENTEHLIPSNIEYTMRSQASRKLSKLITKMYFGERMQNFSLSSLIEFMSDTQNVYGAYFWIEKYKNISDNHDVFFYVFDFNGEFRKNTSPVNGVSHGSDIPYFFVTNDTKVMYNSMDDKTKQMKGRMINFISNFIYHGNPTPEKKNNQILWPDYGKDQNYLLINENPVVQRFSSSPMFPRMQFWEKVYNDYYKYLENGGKIQKKIIP